VSSERIGPAGSKLIAEALRASVTGALTELNIAGNSIKDEGITAICNAVQGNKLTKLNVAGNNISQVGATAVAAFVAVTGGLTALDLSQNDLKDEGVSAVCEAIQSNKETKLASLNFENNGIGPVGANAVAAMVAVTGGLTVIDLSGNQLCGIWTDWRGQHGTYTAEGITAIADALRVNGALTEIDVSWNFFGPEGAKVFADALRVNGALTEVRWPSVFGPQIVTCSELTACALRIQVNLDGYALPIKKLKGTEPVESLDLSNKGLSVASAIVIASLIGVNGGLMEVWETCQPTAS
jgi:Ran GTPase-activating protein (RanGAP) involved in mRNA processing and transport